MLDDACADLAMEGDNGTGFGEEIEMGYSNRNGVVITDAETHHYLGIPQQYGGGSGKTSDISINTFFNSSTPGTPSLSSRFLREPSASSLAPMLTYQKACCQEQLA
jgi:hypothetical protein